MSHMEQNYSKNDDDISSLRTETFQNKNIENVTCTLIVQLKLS